MKILILHGTIVKHDAIGNDVFWMANVLSEKYKVFCYADVYKFENLNFLTLEEVFDFISCSENVLIYHHSIFWELGEEILHRSKCKILFKYHNITPGSFFVNYSEESVIQCEMGRHQTIRLVNKFKKSMWLCDSSYNAQDINGAEKIEIVPPFNVIESWNSINENLETKTKLVNLKKCKILFVGRIAPNKGFKRIIEVIYRYKLFYNQQVEIFFIGKCFNPTYLLELKEEIYKKGIQDQVTFVGEADKEILKSYYLNCDIFLCLSEHEGFCVPVVEAQYFNLPVIAYDQPAVKETLGDGQFVFENNIDLFPVAINEVFKNQFTKNELIKNGRKNFFNRFSFEKIKNTFVNSLKKEGLF